MPLVLALAAVSDDLIYYSTEFKQYMSDLLVALGCLLLAWDLEERELTLRRLAMAAGLGVAATWFSLPSVFMLAGTGLWLAVRAVWERRWRRLAALAVLGGAWGSSFAACFVVSSRLLGESRFMWTWWDFAFLPLPPRSLADVERSSGSSSTSSPTRWGSSAPWGLPGPPCWRLPCSSWEVSRSRRSDDGACSSP